MRHRSLVTSLFLGSVRIARRVINSSDDEDQEDPNLGISSRPVAPSRADQYSNVQDEPDDAPHYEDDNEQDVGRPYEDEYQDDTGHEEPVLSSSPQATNRSLSPYQEVDAEPQGSDAGEGSGNESDPVDGGMYISML